tara:strand:+ start:47 stop:196 length:150 start_codon:yes stop_codon:yes gene_type:complete
VVAKITKGIKAFIIKSRARYALGFQLEYLLLGGSLGSDKNLLKNKKKKH